MLAHQPHHRPSRDFYGARNLEGVDTIQAREPSQLGGSPRIHAGEERFSAPKKVVFNDAL